MSSNEEIIKNYELKIKKLVALQNANNDSNDLSICALRDYCTRQEQIDRLQFAIKQLKKRGAE